MDQPPSDPRCPISDVDLWADEVLANPYPTYATLRNLGPVVWLSRVGAYALPRYQEVREALQSHDTFSSARGVGIDPAYNKRAEGSILTSDPPEHDRFRKVLNPQLVPRALTPHRDMILRRAEEIVDSVVSAGTFDAAADLAQPYTVELLADLIGLPAEGRDQLLARATDGFDTFGPPNERMIAALGGLRELFRYCQHDAVPGRLTPDGWGQRIYDAGVSGDLEPEDCPRLMLAYVWAGMDTTVNAIASAVWLFATNPYEWDRVRADPSLIPSAFNEVLRIEAPVQRFSRLTTEVVSIDEIELPAGSRVALLFGSANRDPRHYPDPDRFDVGRNPIDHLSLGRGVHRCVGAPLALLEGHAVIAALASRVARFHEISTTWRRNNAVHGPESVVVRCS